jgi:hypothetical protein
LRIDGAVDTATKTVRTRITESTKTYPQQATFQLAHEAIHCLAPVEREEGLANHFSLSFGGLPQNYRTESEKMVPEIFRGPLAAFRKLSPTDDQIRNLRNEQPVFDKFTPELIRQHCGADKNLALELCLRLPFDRPAAMLVPVQIENVITQQFYGANLVAVITAAWLSEGYGVLSFLFGYIDNSCLDFEGRF